MMGTVVLRRVARWAPYALRLSAAVLLAMVLFALAGQSAAAGVVLVPLVVLYAIVALPARRVVRVWWIARTRHVPWAAAAATEKVLYWWPTLCGSAGLGRRREDAEREELRRVRVDHQGAQLSEGPSTFDMLRLVFGVAGLLRLDMGIPAHNVREFMGHSSLAVTSLYTTAGKQAARRTVERFYGSMSGLTKGGHSESIQDGV